MRYVVWIAVGGCSFVVVDPVVCTTHQACVEAFGEGASCLPSGLCDVDDTGALLPRIGMLSGTVSRIVPPAGDGVGRLFIGVFPACDLDATPYSVFQQDVDLNSAEARVPYLLTELPHGPVQLATFLDDDANANGAGLPFPSTGDLVYGYADAGDLLECLAVDLSDGDVVDAAIPLNLVQP